MKDSSAKEKKLGKKWMEKIAMRGGEAPKGYCHEKLWILELGGHNGRKSLILAPQEIPDISGYQLGFGCRFVKAYNTENPVTSQKIL